MPYFKEVVLAVGILGKMWDVWGETGQPFWLFFNHNTEEWCHKGCSWFDYYIMDDSATVLSGAAVDSALG